jgi:diadenosine tetraphosphatase ApaH/serine/threonine PP2A family protein phosphatase
VPRYGLLADIHGNLPALRAAVEHLTDHGAERWLCAGDVVGYGPEPNECVAELAGLAALSVAGNHELIALGELSGARCSRRARESLDWTRGELTARSRDHLAALPRTLAVPGLVMAHGSLSDPEEYIRGPGQARAQLERLAEDHPDAHVLVLGHTHRAMLHRAGAGPEPVSYDVRTPLDPGGRYLVNPGSVGQSREREARPRARFALIDLPAEPGAVASVRFFALPYDDRAVRARLRARRLPADSMHVQPGTMATARRRARRLPGYLAIWPGGSSVVDLSM